MERFKPLTILFVPTYGNELISCSNGLVDDLQERGHKIVFSVDISSKEGRLSSPSIRYNYSEKFSDQYSDCSSIEIVKNFSLNYLKQMFEENKAKESYYKELIDRIKPDIIITDSIICSPVLTNCGIPWVWLNFGGPNLYLNDDRLPPAWSGLPKKGKKQEWETFRKQWNELFKDLMFEMNEWCVSKGAPKLPENKLHPHSPHLNIYIYPKELDYRVLDLSHTNWVQIDCMIKKTNQKFSLPKELMEKPGKLIYLSMGEFADSDLMKRLTSLLANSPNKFIVSKGPFHEEYQLPDNMLGFQVLPQTNIIPIVDLVITCGDNKTIIEAFYFCKPVIVMPLFGDHLDNAQRMKENGFGLTINPYTCNKETLFCGINAMLDDRLLARRLSSISHRMQNSNNEKHLSNLIESIINA